MVNPFTVQTKIFKIQTEVLRPLYTMYNGQKEASHQWLLVLTGRAIADHRSFIEELCQSRVVAVVFKIVKLLGGADRLTTEDFDRFTSYVNKGGLKSMIQMLLASDKEKVFLEELARLPIEIQKNAPLMLKKSSELHSDFIQGYFKQNYGARRNVPEKLQQNFEKSTDFILKLSEIATANV